MSIRHQLDLHKAMTAKEIADEYGLDADTVRRELQKGHLPADSVRRSGATWLVHREAAENKWGYLKRRGGQRQAGRPPKATPLGTPLRQPPEPSTPDPLPEGSIQELLAAADEEPPENN